MLRGRAKSVLMFHAKLPIWHLRAHFCDTHGYAVFIRIPVRVRKTLAVPRLPGQGRHQVLHSRFRQITDPRKRPQRQGARADLHASLPTMRLPLLARSSLNSALTSFPPRSRPSSSCIGSVTCLSSVSQCCGQVAKLLHAGLKYMLCQLVW